VKGDLVDDDVTTLPEGILFQDISPNEDRFLQVLPSDSNIIQFHEFYLLVEDGAKPTTNKQIFGPFVLNITCDNNIITPVFESSISYYGQTSI
jgi:hypothetical protein